MFIIALPIYLQVAVMLSDPIESSMSGKATSPSVSGADLKVILLHCPSVLSWCKVTALPVAGWQQ